MDILSRVNDLLDRKLYEATILSEIGRVARNLVHFDETFTSVMGLVGRVVDFTVGAMAFVDEGDELEVVLMPAPAARPAVSRKRRRACWRRSPRSARAPCPHQSRLFAPAAEAAGLPEETRSAASRLFPW